MTAGAICGGVPQASERRFLLNRRLHPGFGVVTLLQDGERVDSDFGHSEWQYEHTLQWYENRARKTPVSKWTIEVDGSMSSYTLTRQAPNTWTLTEGRRGFA